MKRKTIDIISAVSWTIFGYGLAYTSYLEENVAIAVLGGVIGTAWLLILITTLTKKEKNEL